MPNPAGHIDSIKKTQFSSPWRSGATRTIRVPIALADATLEFARKLDKGIEPHDTVNNLNFEVEASVTSSPDTRGSSDEVKQLKDEIERLQNELSNLRSQLEAVQVNPPITPVAEFKLPEPASALNLLKGKHKKSKADQRDIEALWEILGSSSP